MTVKLRRATRLNNDNRRIAQAVMGLTSYQYTKPGMHSADSHGLAERCRHPVVVAVRQLGQSSHSHGLPLKLKDLPGRTECSECSRVVSDFEQMVWRYGRCKQQKLQRGWGRRL